MAGRFGHMPSLGAVARGQTTQAIPPATRTARELNPFDADPSGFTEPGKLGDFTIFNREVLNSGRTQLAGGLLTSLIQHPSTLAFERLYRRLPEEGMFDSSVTPQNPFTFELGAFQVPGSFSLLLFDLIPNIFRFSGLDPGDFIPIERERFSSILGFSLTVDQRFVGNVEFELDPIPIQRQALQAFKTTNTINPQATIADFAIGRANSFANSAAAATGLLPQRPRRYGAPSIPFTLIANSSQTVQASCVVFRPIPTPIAFIEYSISGLLLPSTWTDAALKIISPVTNAKEPFR
jgi:hypothetical protein